MRSMLADLKSKRDNFQINLTFTITIIKTGVDKKNTSGYIKLLILPCPYIVLCNKCSTIFLVYKKHSSPCRSLSFIFLQKNKTRHLWRLSHRHRHTYKACPPPGLIIITLSNLFTATKYAYKYTFLLSFLQDN